MYIKSILVLSFLLFSGYEEEVKAQVPVETPGDTTGSDDLMSLLEEEPAATSKEYTTATFKSTRIANGHSIESTGKGVLDFRVSHRFGMLNQGLRDFFGLDNATTRIGFDYGVTDWLMIGLGRSSFMREYDGFLKAKVLRQREDGGLPFSVSYMGALSIQDNDVTIPAGTEYFFTNRMAYVNQLLIARKFSQAISLQLMPTHVHYNLVQYRNEPNDVIALGLGGRIKLSNRISLTGEYYYLLPDNRLRDTRNSLTLGFDIETGGHVFQLLFSNSTGITERYAIGQTTGDWGNADIHFGFNISRVFTIVKPKGFENSRNKIW